VLQVLAVLQGSPGVLGADGVLHQQAEVGRSSVVPCSASTGNVDRGRFGATNRFSESESVYLEGATVVLGHQIAQFAGVGENEKGATVVRDESFGVVALARESCDEVKVGGGESRGLRSAHRVALLLLL